MEEVAVAPKTIEALNDLYEKAKLQLKDLKNDGDKSSKPYFENVILYVNELLQDINEKNVSFVRLTAMKSSLLFEQAKILIAKTEMDLSLDVLKEALETIKDMKENPHVMYLYFRILNHYAYMLAKTNRCEQARNLLEEANKFYIDLETKNAILVYSTDDLFQDVYLLKGNNILKFEKLITNNYQMLAWVCNKLGDMDYCLIYHNTVLKRQLTTKDGHPYTWVSRAARIASCFCGLDKFKEARYHLLAAHAVLQEYELDLLRFRKEPHFPDQWDALQHYYADLGKQWIKYAIYLFAASRGKTNATNKNNEQLLEDLLNSSLSGINFNDSRNEKSQERIIETSPDKGTPPSTETSKLENDVAIKTSSPAKEVVNEVKTNLDGETKAKVSAVDSYDFTFPSLNLQQKEASVIASVIKTPDEARNLFMYAQEWIRRAKNFYNIRDYTLENINLILDLNELYKHLVNYEYDFDSVYSIQKRRSDILETLIAALKELKPQCYLEVSIELLRELTEVQIDLITLNLKKLCTIRTTSTPNVSSAYQENVRKLESLSILGDHLVRSTTSL